ncbi:hypothetical protein ACFV0T_07845 [Streptomyces sp. NPDC059582]|uniref:hypothetical protein n=1 Tax=Streptomyces sp. NPDC059582 TaxID=3346875 RepID=UPI0036BB35D3
MVKPWATLGFDLHVEPTGPGLRKPEKARTATPGPHPDQVDLRGPGRRTQMDALLVFAGASPYSSALAMVEDF